MRSERKERGEVMWGGGGGGSERREGTPTIKIPFVPSPQSPLFLSLFFVPLPSLIMPAIQAKSEQARP